MGVSWKTFSGGFPPLQGLGDLREKVVCLNRIVYKGFPVLAVYVPAIRLPQPKTFLHRHPEPGLVYLGLSSIPVRRSVPLSFRYELADHLALFS